MRTLKIFFVLSFFLSVSCEDVPDSNPESSRALNKVQLNGKFIGQFVRSTPYADWTTSTVEITLDNGNFSGTSDHPLYPAICHGTYTIAGDSITFRDECIWTTNFDWTLILNGTFHILGNSDGLSLKKNIGTETTDRYMLDPL